MKQLRTCPSTQLTTQQVAPGQIFPLLHSARITVFVNTLAFVRTWFSRPPSVPPALAALLASLRFPAFVESSRFARSSRTCWSGVPSFRPFLLHLLVSQPPLAPTSVALTSMSVLLTSTPVPLAPTITGPRRTCPRPVPQSRSAVSEPQPAAGHQL